jgi:rare lipoprotein A (peptidoglycan hydrolase)
VLVQGFLLDPASAAEKTPDECGLVSLYSSVSEATASGEDTLPENFTAAHQTPPFGTLVHVDNQENGRWAVVRITIAALSSSEESSMCRRPPRANSVFPV